MRPISSIRSISSVTSRRREGTRTSISSATMATAKPRRSSRSVICKGVSSVANKLLAFATRNEMLHQGAMFGNNPTGDPKITPKLRCSMRKATRDSAAWIPTGSTPLSKRSEAAVNNPKERDVRRMLLRLKYADSMTTVWVVEETSLANDPITPAIATAPALSAITTVPEGNWRSSPSRVTILSAPRLSRTMIVLPTIFP